MGEGRARGEGGTNQLIGIRQPALFLSVVTIIEIEMGILGLEIGAKNADYLIRLSPEHDRVPYDDGISIKASLPKAVAENHNPLSTASVTKTTKMSRVCFSLDSLFIVSFQDICIPK